MATLHLISGLPCSGKTTYSQALVADSGGVHFWLDYWLITAFGRYRIEAVGHEEHVRRVLACRELIWHSAEALLVRGVDAILDDGFFLRRDRERHIALAARLGAAATTHWLRAPEVVLRARIEARNADLPRFNFSIDPGMLGAFRELFEVPSREEGAELVVVSGTDLPPLDEVALR